MMKTSPERDETLHSKLPAVCRTCLKDETSEDAELYQISEIFLGEGEVTAQIQSFEEVLCLFVNDELGKHNDLLPTTICLVCVEKARMAFQFIEMCRETDSVLEHCLTKDQPIPVAGKVEAVEKPLHQVEHIAENDVIPEENEEEAYLITLEDEKTDENRDNSIKLEYFEQDSNSDSESASLHSTEKNSIEKTDILLSVDHQPLPKKRRKHEAGQQNVCEICHKTFSQPQTLTRHKKIHTKESDPGMKCSYCSRPFLRADDLKRHIRTHTNERPYACDICPKAYKQSNELREHKERAHLKEGDPRRVFPCSMCDKQFTSRNGLYVHIKAHRGEKNHRCSFCEKRFVTSSELLSHKKHIHAKEIVLLRCGLAGCTRCFATNFALKRHWANVHAYHGDLSKAVKVSAK